MTTAWIPPTRVTAKKGEDITIRNPTVQQEFKDMKRVSKLVGAGKGYLFGAHVQAIRPATDYTARMIPYHAGISVPLKAAHILWQR